jgi:hypothetical protein
MHDASKPLSPTELRQRRLAALRTGARSPSLIKQRARAHRRRFLRQCHLKASGLDAIALAYLDGWARALAKLDLYDDDPRYRERDPKEYHAALNSARLWMAKLEARLRDLGLDRAAVDPYDALEAHLAELRARKAADGD